VTEGPRAAEARELLAGAREERDAAAHVIALQRIGAADEPAAGLFAIRREIELEVAELRLARWSAVLRQLESRLRGMGLRP
jgi:hypothetical protein